MEEKVKYKPLWQRASFVLPAMAMIFAFIGMMKGLVDGGDFTIMSGVVAGGNHVVNWQQSRK